METSISGIYEGSAAPIAVLRAPCQAWTKREDRCLRRHFRMLSAAASTARGIDRILMLLAGEENLCKHVPHDQSALDMLMNAPSPATPKQLKDLHLRVVYPEKA